MQELSGMRFGEIQKLARPILSPIRLSRSLGRAILLLSMLADG